MGDEAETMTGGADGGLGGPVAGWSAAGHDTDETAVIAARAADDKGGADTVILRVGDVLGITELFVITGVRNVRSVRAVVDEIEARVKQRTGASPRRVEGLDDLHWVLMDYGDWVAHIFLDETRGFYDLERLWSDVPRVEWAEPGPTRA